MLWHCNGCTTRYAESLDMCPHCGGVDRAPAHEIDGVPEAAPLSPSAAEGEQG